MQFHPESLRDELVTVSERLRLPAGTDERFQSLDGITSNRADFVAAVHATWKELHRAAVSEIVRIEEALKHGPPDRDFLAFLRVMRQIMRKISDAIVWVIVGERYVIKRLCKNRSRALLKDSNLKDSLYILDEFNKLDEEIAIWTDASSCVDIGDFLYRGPKTRGGYSFLELKAGRVNEAIGDVLETKWGIVEKSAAIEEFATTYGEKAVQQLERTLRQSMTDDQLLKITRDDEGFDPILKAHVKVLDPNVTERTYDSELDGWIAGTAAGSEMLVSVDDCLHVWISRDRLEYGERLASFVRRLTEARATSVRWAEENMGDPTKHIATVDQTTFDPLSRPLFLRQLSAANVADVLHGALVQRVLLFFDWHAFGAVVERAGGRLAWTTKREGRRERSRPGGPELLLVGDRIPRIELDDGFGIRLGTSEISRVFYDGVTPATVAEEYVGLLKLARANPIAMEAFDNNGTLD